jgi:S-adenosylmethionine uptake transporter
MGATAYMTVRSLGRIGEPEWRTVLLFSSSVVITGLAGVTILGISDYTLTSSLYLLGVGLSGLGGQLSMTRAFSRGSTTLSATLQYTGIIFSSLIGYQIWGETLNHIGALGMILVIVSGVAATLYARQRNA